MDNRLFEAIRTGNISLFRHLLDEKPFILEEFQLLSPHGNPLHVAAKAGQLLVVREIIKRKPEQATESNQDGFRAMDIASALGHLDIVREIHSKVPGISRMPGRDGRSAIHYAALYGRIDIMKELLTAYPESIKDVTIFNETAVYLAVKNNQFEAFKKLIRWLQQLGFGELVNWSDKDGNTILHLAVSQRQHATLEVLLGTSGRSSSDTTIITLALEMNKLNSKGLTAMDLMHMLPQNPIDDAPLHMRQILRDAGALRAHENKINSTAGTSTTYVPQVGTNNTQQQQHNNNNNNEQEMKEDLFKFVSYQPKRDSPSEMRAALLTVAALIATVTFQAGLTPPTKLFSSTLTIFVAGNTLGLSASATIIEYLTRGFPFQREIRVSLFSMGFAYGSGVGCHLQGRPVAKIVVSILFFIPLLLRLIPKSKKFDRNPQNPPSSSTSQEAALQLTTI